MGRTKSFLSGQLESYYRSTDVMFSAEVKGGASQWLGEGAKALGLTGVVDFKDVVDIAHGYSNGVHMVGKNSGEQSHDKRAAIEFPLTVDKSSSITATFDDKLREGIAQIFVDATKGIEESGWIKARQTTKGVTEVVQAKMISMLSVHSTSRSTIENSKSGCLAVDPHMHGHDDIMNFTIRETDGKAATLFNDDILTYQSLIQQ